MRDFDMIADGLCNVEGPTAGPDRWILNVCSISRPNQPAWPTRGGDITATRLDGSDGARLVLNTAHGAVVGIPAAIAFGPDGAMYVTDEGRRAIVRVTPDGRCEDFISHYEAKPINGPNDLSFAPNGDLYFTDPWGSSTANPIGSVYGYCWATGDLTQIDTGMAFPNGIVVDGGRLLVAETLPRVVWSYELAGGGKATGKRLFCELPLIPGVSTQGPDGMCIDIDGNLYVAHFGSGAVYVYDQGGGLLEEIAVPGALPTNVCFGGVEHRDLFITVDDTGQLLRVRNHTSGRVVPFCPSTTGAQGWTERFDSLPCPDGRRHY